MHNFFKVNLIFRYKEKSVCICLNYGLVRCLLVPAGRQMRETFFMTESPEHASSSFSQSRHPGSSMEMKGHDSDSSRVKYGLQMRDENDGLVVRIPDGPYCTPMPAPAAASISFYSRAEEFIVLTDPFSRDSQDNKGYLIPWLVMIAIVTMFEVCLAGYLLSETVRNTVRNNSYDVYCYVMTVPVPLYNRNQRGVVFYKHDKGPFVQEERKIEAWKEAFVSQWTRCKEWSFSASLPRDRDQLYMCMGRMTAERSKIMSQENWKIWPESGFYKKMPSISNNEFWWIVEWKGLLVEWREKCGRNSH